MQEILVVNGNTRSFFGLQFRYYTVAFFRTNIDYSNKRKGKENRSHNICFYTAFMLGVDLPDWHLEKYSIAIQAMMFCFINRFTDTAVVNAFRNKFHGFKSMTNKYFSRYISVT